MLKKIPVHKWKSKNLVDGTGSFVTIWREGEKENLSDISKYNNRELYEDLILSGAVYRSAPVSKLDTILEKGIDRTDTLKTSKMFWASLFAHKCVEYGGDRKAIMAYDGSKVVHTTEEERIQPDVEKEFQCEGYQHIYRFLVNPLDALTAVILIEPME